MNTLYLKVVGGTVALGSLGTGAYFGGKELLRAPTIKEKLSSENFKFISADNSGQWAAEFSSDEAAIKKALISVTGANSLKDWCQSKYSSPSTNAKDLENVMKWCGIRDISSQLKRKQKTLLVGLSGTGIEDKWTATINKRKNTKADRAKLDLKGTWDENKQDDTSNIKNWCSKNSKVDFKAEEGIYKLVEAWCTEEGKGIELS